MARPSQFDRRDAIHTAMNEIWRNGYERKSVKALSQKLVITRSSFYNAFESREAFFQDVLKHYFAQAPDRVLQQDSSAMPVKELFTKLFMEICRVRAADPEGRGCTAINCLCELKGGKLDDVGSLIAEAVLNNTTRINELLA